MIIEDKVYYSVSKSFLHDIGLSLTANDAVHQEDNAVPLVVDSRVKCHHCTAVIKLKDMRKHVGKHILQKTLKNQHVIATCGFCGKHDTCISDLECSSRRGANLFFRIKSDCSYRVEYNKQPTKYSTRNKCSNGLVRCKVCKIVFWKYNIKLHFDESHDSADFPEDYLISDAERSAMM